MATKHECLPAATPTQSSSKTFAELFPTLNAFIDGPVWQGLGAAQLYASSSTSSSSPAWNLAKKRSQMEVTAEPSTATESAAAQQEHGVRVMSLDWFLNRRPAQPKPVEQQAQPPRHPKHEEHQAKSISETKSSEATVSLAQMCQIYRMQPQYEYEEFTPQAFGVTLKLSGLPAVEGLVFTSPAHGETLGHPNKRAAKEAVSDLALQAIKGIDLTSQFQQQHAQPTGWSWSHLTTSNWPGQLQEYVQRRGGPMPNYQYYPVRLAFACEVRLGDRVYGDKTCTYSTKKAARAAAAKAAMAHLESQKDFSGGRPAKRQKSTSSEDSSVAGSVGKDGRALNPLMLINEACSRMRIAPPEWRFEPHPIKSSYFSGGAYFKDAPLGVAPDQVVGKVRNVLGKKRAKADSAKVVLELLRDVESRKRSK